MTWRANSALAIRGVGDLERSVAAVEAFYSAKAAPARILVSQASAPPGLPALLGARGYRPERATVMMVARAAEVSRATSPGPWDLRVARAVGDDWFEAFWSVEAARGHTQHDAEIYRRVLLSPDRPQRLAAAVVDGEVAGTGQGVLDAGWCGVQCMTTRSAHRRRGAATAVLAALAAEAAAAGAGRLYLAVQAGNRAALDCYERAGFRPVHRYEYWCRAPYARATPTLPRDRNHSRVWPRPSSRLIGR